MDEEFKDIPISDVEIMFTVVTQDDGRQSYSTGIQYSQPLPLSLYGIWALQQGISVGVLSFHQEALPPFPDCFQVLVATDQVAMCGRRWPALCWLLADWYSKPLADDDMLLLRQSFGGP